MDNVNWLSLILAALVPTVTGMIFYSKPLFQKPWMEAVGMTEEKMKLANMPMVMGVSLVMSFLIAFFLMGFNNGLGQEGEFDTFGHGAAHGVVLTLFLILPVLITKGLYEHASWKGMLLGGLYWAITLALMGGIVDVMNHFPNVAQ